MNYMNQIENVTNEDIRRLREKDEQYGGSWKKRGGHSAAENVMRKIDRLTHQLGKYNWDIFAAIKETEYQVEGVLDTVRDLRCYLILVEAEMLTRKCEHLILPHVDTTGQTHPFGFDPKQDV